MHPDMTILSCWLRFAKSSQFFAQQLCAFAECQSAGFLPNFELAFGDGMVVGKQPVKAVQDFTLCVG
jgi:hypothetical protein